VQDAPTAIVDDVRAASARGETVVGVRTDGDVVAMIGLATPLRTEAGAALQSLTKLGLRATILSGDSPSATQTVGAALGIDDAHGALTPQGKLDALAKLRDQGRHVLMVGDGVNDAPALAAADVGCAVGGGTDVALETSDVALLGSDLRGVPTAVSLARATYGIIVQNFGWAMGYNLAALPLAAAGLLDPLVAAAAMGLSSVVVVLNSLRLRQLGRRGPVRAVKRVGRRAIVGAVFVPIFLFAGVTAASEAISPARGASLLPTLPSITTQQFSDHVTIETYLEAANAGPNVLHVFVTSPTNPLLATASARRSGGGRMTFTMLRLGAGHFEGLVRLASGTWQIRVSVLVRSRTDVVSFAQSIE
jgi:soluble P-type ATPase